jgi:hypothetical protein
MIELLGVITGLLTVILGGGSVLFYRQNNRMKKLEGNAKSIENDSKISDGWQEYAAEMKKQYDGIKEEYDKLMHAYSEKDMVNQHLKLENQEIRWWKCIVTGCPNRKPPREIERTEEEN